MTKKVLVGVLALAIGLLIGCNGAEVTETVPAEEVPVVTQAEGIVMAESSVEPARWTELRTDKSGLVVDVSVNVGDRVSQGDLLLRFDPTDAELAVQRAEAALALAEADLAKVKGQPRSEEIAVTEAQLETAQATLAQAAAQRDQLIDGEAEAQVAAAKASLAAAQAEQKQAYNLHEQTLKCFNFKLPDGSKQTICPALGPTEERARRQWHVTEDKLEAAEAQLKAAEVQAEARIREAQTTVWSASAQRDALQARLKLQKLGSPTEQIAAAEADVAQAQASLEAAKAALEDAFIHAPFDGTIADIAIDVGDTAAPGQALIVLATLDQLQIHTVDLTELDVTKIAVGQSVTATLDALPDTPLKGHVVRISQQAEEHRGEVTYPITIVLDEKAPELRWGMTALVEISVE